jgi:dUTP pyrophosphatase
MKIQGKFQIGTDGAAGADLFIKDIHVNGNQATIHTGVRVEIPFGYAGLLFARSSLSKTGWILGNSVGVIDSDYRGEIIVKLRYIGDADDYSAPFEIGDRIAQLLVVSCISPNLWEVGDVDFNTKRGAGGFGSTGK